MTPHQYPTFVELCLSGQISNPAEVIDDYIDAWHNDVANGSGKRLHEYLGFTSDEYAQWAEQPQALAGILEERRLSQP